ncbi:endolytic transglycosylase MltG [Falsirhodobacter halotolerans]|uniref:endolytic transglycosylase MltG n=1 Tax=Falsirhodobacter halotolerans TaxID=1146892 RepID=UPI001FD2BC4E|nr:endolytic transglycosylase MltG [Falsirhodobacter halotolerans]MCJ8139291.1 endolytic transglycosylase MltG [Falsirhodobacter halotolerans]
MWKSIASNALTMFIVILVVVAGLIAWGRETFYAPGPLTQAICLQVDRGANMRAVAEKLDAQGAIRSSTVFLVGAAYTEKQGQLKFGSYLIPTAASMPQMLEIVTAGGQSTCGREINYQIGVATAQMVLRDLNPETGRFEEVAKYDPAAGDAPEAFSEEGDLRLRVTLAEGVTSWQVVDSLKRAGFLSGEVADVPAEGSLAPDSYEVTDGLSREVLLTQMAERQTRILADMWASRASDLPYESPEEALIMASIVEKETGIADERPMVASVFVNRLRQGMRLQTDPTVIYGVTNGEGVLGRGIRASELRARNPYNTYVIDGLPPTPIANPGRLSIQATLHPAESDYVYFVADGSGGHAFGRTLEEHNANVAKWREIERARGETPEGGVQTGN